MRKRIIAENAQSTSAEPAGQWLDLEALASVELTSEAQAFPIESALKSNAGPGWRAGTPGTQMIRLLFDQPRKITHIYLLFLEEHHARTQEFVLTWYPDDSGSGREIVRQQYNFSPPATAREQEDYSVNLDHVARLELTIIPDISGGAAHASLARLRLA